METYDNEEIYYLSPGGCSCTIIVSGQDGQDEPIVVPRDKFKWHREVYEGGFYDDYLTLSEIGSQLKQMGLKGVFYVAEHKPLDGNIYYYGNYFGCYNWLKYGNVVGYA